MPLAKNTRLTVDIHQLHNQLANENNGQRSKRWFFQRIENIVEHVGGIFFKLKGERKKNEPIDERERERDQEPFESRKISTRACEQQMATKATPTPPVVGEMLRRKEQQQQQAKKVPSK